MHSILLFVLVFYLFKFKFITLFLLNVEIPQNSNMSTKLFTTAAIDLHTLAVSNYLLGLYVAACY